MLEIVRFKSNVFRVFGNEDVFWIVWIVIMLSMIVGCDNKLFKI